MSVSKLKRLVPVGGARNTRALVDRLAEHHVFEASAAQRMEIIRRADALLAMPSMDEESARDLKFDLADGDWKIRAKAASRLSDSGTWTPWTVAGSLGHSAPGDGMEREAERAASAILVAARETLVPDVVARHVRLEGSARAALAHEKDGASHWDDVMRPLVAEFAGNARRHGADRATAALRALSAAAHLKGRAMGASSDEDAFSLGAAASSLLQDESEDREDGAPTATEDLARLIASLNDARAVMWDDADVETTRLMGASAAFASFGRGTAAKPAVNALRKTAMYAHLPAEGLRRYAHLNAAEAADALDEQAADARLDAPRRRRLETLADALRNHPAAHAVSCAEALEMEAPETREGELQPGMKVYRAVMANRRRPVICEGKNGRAVRCRAIAGPDGAFVGYLAYDALSREFGGRSLYAAYALDGSRYGYAWADGRPVIRRGEPEQGFKTAPPTIHV